MIAPARERAKPNDSIEHRRQKLTVFFFDAFAFRDSSVVRIRVPENCIIGPDAFDGCDIVFIFSMPGALLNPVVTHMKTA